MLTKLRAIISTSKAKAKAEKSLGGARIKTTRQDIESILMRYKIDRGAHHGGDLVGGACHQLMKLAVPIFEELQAEILLIPGNERHAGDAEVMERCRATVEALQHFDALFSFLRIPNGLVTESDYTAALDHAKKALACWRGLSLSVSVKAHLLETHAVWEMWLHKGIGDFLEDFIEQGHQYGIAEGRWSNGLHDRASATNSHSKWETMRLHPLVEQEAAKAIIGTKRRLKTDAQGRTTKMVRDENKKIARDNQREQMRADDRAAPVTIIAAEEQAKLDYRLSTYGES
jgi:hypothetical protein